MSDLESLNLRSMFKSEFSSVLKWLKDNKNLWATKYGLEALMFRAWIWCVYRERVPPDPIPNSVVKPLFADGTAWEAVWESRAMHLKIEPQLGNHWGFFICYLGCHAQTRLRIWFLHQPFQWLAALSRLLRAIPTRLQREGMLNMLILFNILSDAFDARVILREALGEN